MEYIAFGRTNFLVSRAALAVNSLKLLDDQEQAALIQSAYDAGVNFFGLSGAAFERQLPALASAFHGIRRNVFLSLCLAAPSAVALRKSLERVLLALNTDYIDVLHITGFSGANSPSDGIVAALTKIKTSGIIRAAGFTLPAKADGPQVQIAQIFESLQFPFNLCSPAENKERILLCERRTLGCVIADPLCAPFEELEEAYNFLSLFEHAVPLWEVRTAEQMAVFLRLASGKSQLAAAAGQF
jgi:aryl-alcohol dehydrogenase-like predicted oxidoreductase